MSHASAKLSHALSTFRERRSAAAARTEDHHQPSKDTMTDNTNMPDDPRQRIIEAATLMLKQQHLDQGEECDRVGRALHATLAQLYAEAPEGIDALMMVQHLLDGKPYSMTSDNPDSIQLRIDLAHAIGATVEDGPLADALPSGLRSIGINPPSRGQAVTEADAPRQRPATTTGRAGMRISRRPIDPDNTDLVAMVTETFEAIAADPKVAMEVIEQIAFLARTCDDDDPEDIKQRGEILDGLVECVTEAMYENYEREIDKESGAVRMSSQGEQE